MKETNTLVLVSSSPPENSLHSSDAHPVHNVSGQSEGDGLRGREDLPLLKGHTWTPTEMYYNKNSKPENALWSNLSFYL